MRISVDDYNVGVELDKSGKEASSDLVRVGSVFPVDPTKKLMIETINQSRLPLNRKAEILIEKWL